MTASGLSREEQDLAAQIAATGDPVGVLLGESSHPGTRVMADRVRRALDRGVTARLFELGYTRYRTWAESYGAYGTPTLLLFRGDRLVLRLPGVLDEETLLRVLDQHFSGGSSSEWRPR